MPEIQVTDDQLERLDALREELADEVVGKYGHVRRRDALEYLLDQQAEQATEGTGTDGGEAERRQVGGTNGASADAEAGAAVEDDSAGAGASGSRPGSGSGTDDDGDGDEDADADGGGGDDGGAMLDAMMNLMSAHEDKWREASGGDARYEVDLPDGSTGQARTKDDVRALLFKHYR